MKAQLTFNSVVNNVDCIRSLILFTVGCKQRYQVFFVEIFNSFEYMIEVVFYNSILLQKLAEKLYLHFIKKKGSSSGSSEPL